MSLTNEHAALRVLSLIQSPLLDVGGYDDAYEALAAADKHLGSFSTGENELLNIAWAIYNGSHPLGKLDADNAAAVIRVLAQRYAPTLEIVG